jgi:predicted RNA-binding protein with EMAP domain
MDTGNDYRILIVEDAIKRIMEILRMKRFKFQFKHYREAIQLLEHSSHTPLQTVKYCYLEPDAIVEMSEFKEFHENTTKIEQMILEELKAASYKPDNPKDLLMMKEVEYVLSILRDLPRRIQLPPHAGNALDTFSVQVTRVDKHPELDKLFVCRTTDQKQIWNIVTNIQNIKKDGYYPAVHLPPTMFGQVVSEAMFISDTTIMDEPGTILKLTGSLLDSVNSQVFVLLKKGH